MPLNPILLTVLLQTTYYSTPSHYLSSMFSPSSHYLSSMFHCSSFKPLSLICPSLKCHNTDLFPPLSVTLASPTTVCPSNTYKLFSFIHFIITIEPLIILNTYFLALMTQPIGSSMPIEIKFLFKSGTNLTCVNSFTTPSNFLRLTIPIPTTLHI